MTDAIVFAGASSLVQVDPVRSVQIAEKVIAENGNLVKLTAIERKTYYLAMCAHHGFDPWSNPFDYLESKGKDGQITSVKLYPNIRAANTKIAQHNLSVEIVSRKTEVTGKNKDKYGNEYEVGWAEAEVKVSDGKRSLTEIGMVEMGYSFRKGDAIKKAVTQARRRAVLAFCGMSDGGDNTISAENYDPPMDVYTGAQPRPIDVEQYVDYSRLTAVLELTGHSQSEMMSIAKKNGIDVDRMVETDFESLRNALFAGWGAKQKGAFAKPKDSWDAFQSLVAELADVEDSGLFEAWKALVLGRLEPKEVEAQLVEEF